MATYIRLDGGGQYSNPSEGYPQILVQGRWKNVGGNKIDYAGNVPIPVPLVTGAEAAVICRTLGYRAGRVLQSWRGTGNEGPVNVVNYQCGGLEAEFHNCTFKQEWGSYSMFARYYPISCSSPTSKCKIAG